MTYEFQPEEPTALPDTPPEPYRPRKSRKNFWVIVGAILAVFCCCALVGLPSFGTIISTVYKEKEPVEVVLNAFMKDMEDRDVESAYAQFSPRVQRQMPIDELQKMIEGNNFALFDGFQRLSVNYIYLSFTRNLDSDSPQGTVAEVEGVIRYSRGFSGDISATLEKVDDQWRIFDVYIVVPPDKFSR